MWDAHPYAAGNAEQGLDTRLTDGRVDRFGRLWIGSWTTARPPLASLYRIGGDGTVTACFGGVIVPNTIAFAPPDGRTMYFSDTRQHLTWRIPRSEDGRPGERAGFPTGAGAGSDLRRLTPASCA